MVKREAAREWLCGEGSVMEWRVVEGLVRMDWAWRGPIRPLPIIAIVVLLVKDGRAGMLGGELAVWDMQEWRAW